MQICSNVLNSKICKRVKNVRNKFFRKFTGLKTGDVEDADEVDLLHRWVLMREEMATLKGQERISYNEGSVAEVDQPEEEPVVGGSGQGGHGVEALVSVLAFVHPLSTDLEIV